MIPVPHQPAIVRITLPQPGLDELQADARSESYFFVDRLVEEWEQRVNRFNGPGEVLLGSFDSGLLIAVGGLHRDPYAQHGGIARIRRVYVRPALRGYGIGTRIVIALLQEARKTFRLVRLRAINPGAARLYERVGFQPAALPDATHILPLHPTDSYPPGS